MNVDIFAYINFRAFPKIGNFAQIYFRVFFILLPLRLYVASYFHYIIFSRTFDKREQRENMLSAKISTFIVYSNLVIDKSLGR